MKNIKLRLGLLGVLAFVAGTAFVMLNAYHRGLALLAESPPIAVKAQAPPSAKPKAAPQSVVRKFTVKRPTSPPPAHLRFASKMPKAVKLPARVDLRSKDVPILNQGQLGSCTANGWAGALQYRDHNKPIPRPVVPWQRVILIGLGLVEVPPRPAPSDFPPCRLFIYYNERALEGDTCCDNGAQVGDGAKVVSTLGYPPESDWPYSDQGNAFARKPPAKAFKDAKAHVVAPEPKSVDLTDLAEVKTALSMGQPIVFGFVVYESFQSIGADAVYRPAGRIVGGHCVVAVGYDDSKQLIICRNSWGEEWGDQGYFYFRYRDFTDSDQTSDAWTMDVEG